MDYMLIKKSNKYIMISILPQVLACLVGEIFYLYADKNNKDEYFYIAFIVLFIYNVIFIYLKLSMFYKKGNELFDFIEAFDKEQSKSGKQLRQLI